MKIEIQNPWAILAVVLLIILAVVAGGYTLGNIKLPGGIEIGLTPPQPTPTISDFQFIEASPQPVDPFIENHTPILLGVSERKEYKGNDLFIHKDIYFSDADGDAYTVAYKLISSTIDANLITVKNDSITSSADEQKYQAIVVGTWECGIKYGNYTIVLEARILDYAGNQSEPFTITFACQ